MLAAVIGAGVYAHYYAPPQHVPWKPLDPEAPIGLATGVQLNVVAMGPRDLCQSALEKSINLNYAPAEAQRLDNGCGYDVALDVIWSGETRLAGETTLQCPMAVGSHIWLQDVERTANEVLGSPVVRVHHYGSYSCRNIAGSSRWSEHAFANAWDIAGFELADGRLITVKDFWDNGGPEGRFLREVHSTACQIFRVTLGPDYNAAHADHFHLDMGPSSACR